jgi:hypothetical protein
MLMDASTSWGTTPSLLSDSTDKRNNTSSFFFITGKQLKESENYLRIIHQNHLIIHPAGGKLRKCPNHLLCDPLMAKL